MPGQEIRFAVVLNGGASLAVWMGGVTHELHELTHTEERRGVYGELLNILRAKARVDVIAGTSAGGINGAFLALGQVFRGVKLGKMGEMWADLGAFEKLIRSPLEANMPSLLNGEYFLVELRKAFDGVLDDARPLTPYPIKDRPVDLFLTTTLLNGTIHRFSDCFGQNIWETEYTGRFIFSRQPHDHGLPEGDHFIDDQKEAKLATKLALAARSTGSHPWVFEASFIRVQDPEEHTAPGTSEEQVNMYGRVNFTSSSYVIDGGVLLNKPVKPVLEAIWRKPAGPQIHRILLYVNPHPGREPEQKDLGETPSLMRVLAASNNRWVMQQSIHEELHAIRQANEKAKQLRLIRPRILENIEDPRLSHVPEGQFDLYRDLRARHGAMDITEIVESVVRDSKITRDHVAIRRWVIDYLTSQQRTDDPEDHYRKLPYVPPREALKNDGYSGSGESWRWGIKAVDRLGAFVLDQLKRAIWLLPAEEPGEDESHKKRRGELEKARMTVVQAQQQIAAIQRASREHWKHRIKRALDFCNATADSEFLEELKIQLKTVLDEGLEHWHEGIYQEIEKSSPGAPDLRAIVDTLIGCLTIAKRVSDLDLKDLANVSDLQKEYDRLKIPMVRLKIESGTSGQVAEVLKCLLGLEVYFTIMAGDARAKDEQEVDLVVLSVDTESTWTGESKARQKITGFQLRNFGAFYKKSWRVNDWIWGRMDGANQLVLTLLNVERLWRLGVTQDRILAALKTLGWLEELIPEEVKKELQEYDSQMRRVNSRTLTELRHTARLFAKLRHHEFIEEEIDQLAESVQDDRKVGATQDQNSKGNRFLKTYASSELKNEKPWNFDRKNKALELFNESEFGTEEINGEKERGTRLHSDTLTEILLSSAAVLNHQFSFPPLNWVIKAFIKAGHRGIARKFLYRSTLFLHDQSPHIMNFWEKARKKRNGNQRRRL